MRDKPKAGEVWQHFKGDMYKVVCIAEHTEVKDQFVVYCNINSPDKVWVRNLIMFMQKVVKNKRSIYRFTKIKEVND